jgi:hypothetical protein
MAIAAMSSFSVLFGFHVYAILALSASITLYLHAQIPLSGHGESKVFLPMRYRFPLQVTVSLMKGTNQIKPTNKSFNGDRR